MNIVLLLAGLTAASALPRKDMADPEKVKAALIGAEVPEEEAGQIAETIAGMAVAEEEVREGEDADEGDDDPLKLMTAERDALQAELDALKSADAEDNEDGTDTDTGNLDQETDEEKAAAEETAKADRLDRYDARIGLVQMANDLELKAVDVKKLDNAELKRAIVVAANKAVKADATDAYIDAAYDIMLNTRKDAAADTKRRLDEYDGLAFDTDPKRAANEQRADALDFTASGDPALDSLKHSHTARFNKAS